MNQIDIIVRGPGIMINYETIIIRQMFEQLGYDVVINDDHPYNHPVKSEAEFVAEQTRQRMAQRPDIKISITTDHCPWGG